MPEPDVPRPRHATVAIYDRPPWWRSRKALRIALPIVAAVASLAVWLVIFG